MGFRCISSRKNHSATKSNVRTTLAKGGPTCSMNPIRFGSVFRFFSLLVGVHGTAGAFWGWGYRSFFGLPPAGTPAARGSNPTASRVPPAAEFALSASLNAAASFIVPSGGTFLFGCPGLPVNLGGVPPPFLGPLPRFGPGLLA